jgi:hypothetical protein
MVDRLLGAFQSIARGADPRLPYRTLYGAVVESQAPLPSLTVSVRPDDDRLLPRMVDIPLRTGVPGVDVVLKIGGKPIKVLVGWEDGRPDRPYAALWPSGRENAQRDSIERVIIRGLTVELGDEGLDPIRDGVVTGQAIDSFTGMPQWMLGNASTTVLAKK